MAEIAFGSDSYVWALPCGCGVALTRCMDIDGKAVSVDTTCPDGQTVSRLPHQQACQAFAARCGDYPHTDWQKRDERSPE